MPSFARQTGQPCATCHVGAFGPQLTQYGREFKLNGYVWNDGALSTFRVNGSYSYQNTFTLSGQRFETTGTSDAALYGGSPNSAGWTAEIAYVPSGKPNSWFPDGINARLSLQYTAYDKFDGTSIHASDNNTLYLLLWLAGQARRAFRSGRYRRPKTPFAVTWTQHPNAKGLPLRPALAIVTENQNKLRIAMLSAILPSIEY